MKKTLAFGIAAGTLLISSNNAQAATFTIDNFDSGLPQIVEVEVTTSNLPPTNSSGNPNELMTGLSTSNVIGGSRKLFTQVNNALADSTTAKVLVSQQLNSSSNGLYTISYGSGIEGATTATWDADGAGLNHNFLTGTNAFRLDVLTEDLDADLSLTVIGNNGSTATRKREILGVGINIFEYKNFNVSEGTFTDIFSDVKSISLTVSKPDTPTEIDISFDSLMAIELDPDEPPAKTPEPTAVLSLFAIGFGALLRKNKKA